MNRYVSRPQYRNVTSLISICILETYRRGGFNRYDFLNNANRADVISNTPLSQTSGQNQVIMSVVIVAPLSYMVICVFSR